MTHKNWDNLRDNRIYGYLTQAELDDFLQAMQIKDMSQNATAVRTFVVERSQQIIIEHRKQKSSEQPKTIQTVKYRFPSGFNTVTH